MRIIEEINFGMPYLLWYYRNNPHTYTFTQMFSFRMLEANNECIVLEKICCLWLHILDRCFNVCERDIMPYYINFWSYDNLSSKGFLLHRQVQQDGNKNQSMKIPPQSPWFGSKASSRCHLYFCSQLQSPMHRIVLDVLKNVNINEYCFHFLLLFMLS